jgi:pyrroloquinoline-quinone synthase
MEDLRGYSKEYFHLVKAVPNLVGNVIEQVSPEHAQSFERVNAIKHNLEEEKQHLAPWITFAESIGVSRSELHNYECSKKTKDAVLSLGEVSSQSLACGISTLYTFEKQLPEISARKIEGLVNFYGVQDERALDYFRIHQKIDIEHAELWRYLLQTMPASQHESIMDAALKSLNYQNSILDGVCEIYLAERSQIPN